MIEHEQAYIFTHEGLTKFLEERDMSLESSIKIDDYYFSSGFRIRHKSDGNVWRLTKKEGDKADGHRFEDKEDIPEHAARMLISMAKLHVSKERWAIKGLPDTDRNYLVTVDMVISPLKVAILEVEAADEMAMPVPADIAQRLFNAELQNCPLCAWKFFKRKIGICGGPSSGKTETAKWLSHQLNTRFDGNSFHVVEYATTFIQKYDRNPVFNDQILVWFGQWKRELNARKADIVISDCPTFLSYIYTRLLHEGPFNEKDALQLAKIYKQCLFDVNSYSDIIFMEMHGYKDNNIRNEGEQKACEIHERIRQFLDDHNIPHQVRSYHDNDDTLKELLYLND